MPHATILVVDDDPLIRKLVRFNFQVNGFTVISASDGAEGLDRAREDRPDAVILDIMMPGMDGLDVLRALKADPSTAGIPVVLLSAKVQPADVTAGRNAGADDYISKPFDPQHLTQRVEELITTS